MPGSTREGVIKFHLDFTEGAAPEQQLLTELNRWRFIFRELGLIGQDPLRYEGLGFGNLSRRLTEAGDQAFLISGTQTGHLQQLQPEDYALVRSCAPKENRVVASGTVRPSSEALSHGVLYQADPGIRWVMHLHSPDIFKYRTRLDLPATHPATEYGTPEMAEELRRLVKNHKSDAPGLLVMAGHQDGILAFGSNADSTGASVVEMLKIAQAITQ